MNQLTRVFASGLSVALSLSLVPAFAQSPTTAVANAVGGSPAPHAAAQPVVSPGAPGGMVSAAVTNILVYDHNTHHNLAQTAAFALSPGGTVVANSATFDGLLAGGPWDVVAVDCPSNIPLSGWTALTNYVTGGGRVVLSYWDWDVNPALMTAFECSLSSSIDWTGQTLQDSGTSTLFSGVTMPNSDWHNHWGDDGDRFNPLGTAVGLAHIGSPATPVMVLGNGGKTIASSVLDEAGDTWLNDGSGVALWTNMIQEVGGGVSASCVQRFGTLGLNPPDCTCGNNPVIGGTWNPVIATAPTIGIATLSTIVGIGLGGPTTGVPALGGELLILPNYLTSQALGTHAIPVPADPTLTGVAIFTQGLRIEQTGGGGIAFVPTNALDLILGS
jgi:hypothetical protein